MKSSLHRVDDAKTCDAGRNGICVAIGRRLGAGGAELSAAVTQANDRQVKEQKSSRDGGGFQERHAQRV
jgi:hypothetical protein